MQHSKLSTDTTSSGKPKRTFQGVLGSRPVSGDKKLLDGAAGASSPQLLSKGMSSVFARKQVSSPLTPSSTTTATSSVVVAADRHQSVSFAADVLGSNQRRGGSATSLLAVSTRSISSLIGGGYASTRAPLHEASIFLLGQQLKATYTQLDRAVGVVTHESATLLLSTQSQQHARVMDTPQQEYSRTSLASVLKTPVDSPATSTHTTASNTTVTSPLQHPHTPLVSGVSSRSTSTSVIKEDSAWMEEVVEVVAQLMRSSKKIQDIRQRSPRYETLFPRGLQLQYIFSGGKYRTELWTAQESARWIDIAIEAASACLNLDTLLWETETNPYTIQLSPNAVIDTEQGTYTRIWHTKKAARHWIGACKRIMEVVSRFDLDSRFTTYHSCLLVVHGKAVTVTFLVPIVQPTTLNHHQHLLNGNGRIQMEIVTSNAKLCTHRTPPLLRRNQELAELRPPFTSLNDDNDAVAEEVDELLPFALTTIESSPLEEGDLHQHNNSEATKSSSLRLGRRTYSSPSTPRYIQRLRALYTSRKVTSERDLWLLPAPMAQIPDKLPTPHSAFCNAFISNDNLNPSSSPFNHSSRNELVHASSTSFITSEDASSMESSSPLHRVALSNTYQTNIPCILTNIDNLPDSYTGIPTTSSITTTPLQQASYIRSSTKLHEKLLGASQRLLAKAYAESKSRVPGACQYQHGDDDDDSNFLLSPPAGANSDPSSQTEEDEENDSNQSSHHAHGSSGGVSLLTSPLLSPNTPSVSPPTAFQRNKRVVGDTSEKVSSVPHGTFRAAALKGYYYSRDSGFRRDMCMNSSLRARHLYVLHCVADGFCMSKRELVQQRSKMFGKSEDNAASLADKRAKLTTTQGGSLISEIAQKRGFILMATAVRKQLLVLIKSEMVARTLKCLIGQFQDKLRDRRGSSTSSLPGKKRTSPLDIANRYLEYLLSSSATTLETFLMSTVAGPLVVKFGVPLDELSAPVLRATIKHLTKQGMQSPLPENITDADIDSYCGDHHNRLEKQWQARVFTPESVSTQHQQRVTLPKSLFRLSHDDLDVAFIIHMLCASFGYEVNVEKRVFTIAANVIGGAVGDASVRRQHNHGGGRSMVSLSTFSAPAGRRRRPLEPLWPTRSEASTKSTCPTQILSFPHGRGYDSFISMSDADSILLISDEVCTSVDDDDSMCDQVVAVESSTSDNEQIAQEEDEEELPQPQQEEEYESLFGVVPEEEEIKKSVPDTRIIRLPKEINRRRGGTNNNNKLLLCVSNILDNDNEEVVNHVSVDTRRIPIQRAHGYRNTITVPLPTNIQYVHIEEVAMGDGVLGIVAPPRFRRDKSVSKPALSALLTADHHHYEVNGDDHKQPILEFIPTRTIRTQKQSSQRRRPEVTTLLVSKELETQDEVCDCISIKRRHSKGRREDPSSGSKRKPTSSMFPKCGSAPLEPHPTTAARLSIVACMHPALRRAPRDLPHGKKRKKLLGITSSTQRILMCEDEQQHIQESMDEMLIAYQKPRGIDVGVQAIVPTTILSERPSSPSSPFVRVNPLDCSPAELPIVMRKLRSATPLFRYSSWERIRAYFEKGSIYAMICQPSDGSIEEDYINQTTYQYKPQMAAMYVVVTSPIYLKLDANEEHLLDDQEHEQEVSSPAVVAPMPSSSVPTGPLSKMLMPGIMGLRLQRSLALTKSKRAGSAASPGSRAGSGLKACPRTLVPPFKTTTAGALFKDVGTMTSKAILRGVSGSIFTQGSASYRSSSPKRPTTALMGMTTYSSSPLTRHPDHNPTNDNAIRTLLTKGDVAAIAGVDSQLQPTSSPNTSMPMTASSGEGSPPPSLQERIKMPLTDMYCERGAAFWVIAPAAYTVLAENYSKKKQLTQTYTSATPKK